MTSIRSKAVAYDLILTPTAICGEKYYAAMAGAANPAVRCRIWKFNIKNSAATRVTIPS
ncbi:MAG: hypothetical protein ACJ72H_26315 [Candidatus Sulfotelmatobacter sp.]